MTRLRAGIIGLGVGERHIAGFRKHPDVEVAALCDMDPAARARARRTYPDLAIHGDAAALIDDRRIDIVAIASYDDAHFAQVMRAIERGAHVFVEKPLCLGAEELRAIRRALAAHPDRRLSSNLILRVSPRFRELRGLIRSGALGTLFAVEGDYAYGRLEKLTAGWRGRVPGYSVTLGGAIHLIDLILWLTGDRVASVMAAGNGIASRGSAFAGNDFVTAILTFASGMVGKVSANFGCVHPHFHRLLVYGTAATFENGREAALLWQSRDPAAAPRRLVSEYPGVEKGDLIPSFIDAILGNGPAMVSEEDVMAAMAVGLAIDRSVAERRAVEIAEIWRDEPPSSLAAGAP